MWVGRYFLNGCVYGWVAGSFAPDGVHTSEVLVFVGVSVRS